MQIAVWDTYVRREDGLTMHFDILVPTEIENRSLIFEYADQYLTEKQFNAEDIRSSRCQFCHVEQASEEVILKVGQRGFDIIEFENCN